MILQQPRQRVSKKRMKRTEKLDKLRAARGVSQKFLAECAGVPESRLSEWKAYGWPMPVEAAIKLAKALRVPVDFLFDDEQDEPRIVELTEDETFVLQAARVLGMAEAKHRLMAPKRIEITGHRTGDR